jgi:hypothetical protein
VDVIPELIRYMKLSEKPTIGQHCIEWCPKNRIQVYIQHSSLYYMEWV